MIRSILNVSRRPLQAVLIPLVFAVLIGTLVKYLPPLAEDILNNARFPIDEAYYQHARDHAPSFEAADLHCDSLLWTHRDLLRTTTHPLFKGRSLGAVDLPRLIAGNVRTQVFAVSGESNVSLPLDLFAAGGY